jgi:hypothetical protein
MVITPAPSPFQPGGGFIGRQTSRAGMPRKRASIAMAIKNAGLRPWKKESDAPAQIFIETIHSRSRITAGREHTFQFRKLHAI